MSLEDHATTRTGEYTIPLIGIPVSATDMQCEGCHKTFYITEVRLHEVTNKFLCSECFNPTRHYRMTRRTTKYVWLRWDAFGDRRGLSMRIPREEFQEIWVQKLGTEPPLFYRKKGL